ncbi:MAG: hypothetical protein GXO88_07790 [Chlorobi bacterium]|nr:hypothetical protein [Chlorobiota bacterium]
MDPISMITIFFTNVFGYVKSGLDWRHLVNAYETDKSYFVARKYRFSIFPIDFVSIRNSYFPYNNDKHGGPGDYASTYIKVKDIYPFILNAHSSYVYVRSFHKSNPSAFDRVQLNTGYGYVMGTDGRFHAIDANHVGYDQPGTPGILSFFISNDPTGNRRAHAITESGKAYALAPNVQPNILTEMQVLVKGENWIYGMIIFLIFIALVIKSKQKVKK